MTLVNIEMFQVAIVFKTPPYWNLAIERPVKVQLELRRKSDQETSEPVEFTYQPQMFGMSRADFRAAKQVLGSYFTKYTFYSL